MKSDPSEFKSRRRPGWCNEELTGSLDQFLIHESDQNHMRPMTDSVSDGRCHTSGHEGV